MDIRYNDAASRWELLDDGAVIGLADRIDRPDGVVVLPHVEVDPSHRGEGLAGQLVTAVLDELRAAGNRIVPQCPYVAGFVRDHPDYADLVA